MILEIINKWEKNKSKLEEYFKTTKQEEYQCYETIVRKIFEICINVSDRNCDNFNLDKLTVINDAFYYDGTQIFIIPKNDIQPCADDYIVTDTRYGSCSASDTLKRISMNSDETIPNEEQLKEYMTLALHLVQKMHWLSTNNELSIIPLKNADIVRKGFVQAMNGNELWINTQTDEMMKIVVKDRNIQRKLYCKYVKVTIEIIDESEFD